LREFWVEESHRWEEAGFGIEDENIYYLGRVECLGFDLKAIYGQLACPSQDAERRN
jgi:hypothetical protein